MRWQLNGLRLWKMQLSPRDKMNRACEDHRRTGRRRRAATASGSARTALRFAMKFTATCT